MQLIKVKFLKEGQPQGRSYTYYSNDLVFVGDMVQINASTKGIVVEIDVKESEIESFKDKVKTIIGKVNEKQIDGITFTITPKQAERISDYAGIDHYDLESNTKAICKALDKIIDNL